MKIRHIARYFHPRPRIQPHVPLQIVTDYDMRQASELERLAMLTRKARSPEAARRVFERYQVSSTVDLSKIPNYRPSRATLRRLALVLIARLLGGSAGYDPYRRTDRMLIRYRYKR